MIVRIMTDNQYRLGDEHLSAVNALDGQLVQAMDAQDEPAFQAALGRLVALVRQHGTLVPMEEVVPSDIIVPAPDMTAEEAHRLLQTVEARQQQPSDQ